MPDLASVLTIALSLVWEAIQQHHPGVPDVVLLPAPNPHRQTNVLGHFAALRWKPRGKAQERLVHEVVVVAEHLDRSAVDIIATLLHEAAHAQNFERGIFDCSASQYHNKHFKVAAEDLGLVVEQVPHYGFAKTSMPPSTAMRYAVQTAALAAALMHRRMAAPPSRPVLPGGDTPSDDGEGASKPAAGRYKKASCECPHNIRVARSTMAATTITCETCGESFKFA